MVKLKKTIEYKNNTFYTRNNSNKKLRLQTAYIEFFYKSYKLF